MKNRTVFSFLSLTVVTGLLVLFQNFSGRQLEDIGSFSESYWEQLNPFFEQAEDELQDIDSQIYDELIKHRADIEKLVGDIKKIEKILKQAPKIASKLKIKISEKTHNDIQKATIDLNNFRTDLEYWKSQADAYVRDPATAQNVVNQIARIKADYNMLKARIEVLEARYKSTVQYIGTIVKSLDKSTFTEIADTINCDAAGLQNDDRDVALQYFCDELPIGMTKIKDGLSYAQYILDPVRYNTELKILETRVEYQWKMVGRRYQQVAVQVQTAVQRTLSELEYMDRMRAQYLTWNRDKIFLHLPFQYKDKRKIRDYKFDISMARRLNSGFKMYDGKIVAGPRTAYMGTCVNVPGVSVYQNSQKLEYSIFKYPWPANGWYSENFQVTTPGVSFDGLQFCGVFKIDLEDIKRPQISLVYASLPTPTNLQFKPMRIDIKGNGGFSILKALDALLKVFSFGSVSLEGLINSALKDAQGPYVEKFKTGEVFLMFMQEGFLKSLKANINSDPMGQFSQLTNSLGQNQVIFEGNNLEAYLQYFLERNAVNLLQEF
jgi:hypothetical protein